MQVIPPMPVSLARTGASPSYVYSAWATSTTYAKDTIIRDNASGAWRDYRAKSTHTSSSWTRPPNSWYWSDRGPSSVSGGFTWTTNVRLSAYDAWANAQAVAAGSRRYDDGNQHDYQAVIAISSGDNTLRPSEAVLSADETIAARWIDLGSANAWAALDQESNSYLAGRDANNTLVDPVFTVAVEQTGSVDRVAFAGLANVGAITVKVYLSGSLSETKTATLAHGGVTTFGRLPRTAIINLTPIAADASLTLEITLTRAVSATECRLGVLVVGYGHILMDTEWGVETSALSFSRKERNDTFGTMTFLKRGFARQIRATCEVSPVAVSGDVVQQVLEDLDGQPVMWDFNGAGLSYDRLRVYGFYTSMGIVVPFVTRETLSITVESLVE